MKQDTHYAILGILETATESEIKSAYRSLLQKIHPDTVATLSPGLRREAESVTKEILEAYSVLSDPDRVACTTELKIHAVVEEEIFYPAVRKHLENDLMNEADEEHHVARVLVAELDNGGRGNDHRDAKFTVLAESVRHHIREEESEMLPKAKGLEIDFEALGAEILNRKKELKRDGIPRDAEHAMVAATQGKGDTPAAASRRTSPARALASSHRTARKRAGGKKASSRRSSRTSGISKSRSRK